MSVEEPSATSLKLRSVRRKAASSSANANTHRAATQYMARRPELTHSRRPDAAP